MNETPFQFNISLSVLNHLGRNLYRNFITVLGEAVSNAWDAEANNVWIYIDKENSKFVIMDDGIGMDSDDFQNKFLKIGYSKRGNGSNKSLNGRPFIGAKGIGKLALLSCSDKVSIFTKQCNAEYIGGVVDNRDLDEAIQNDLRPEAYPLDKLNFELIEGYSDGHLHGTIIVFEYTKESIRNSEVYIKKLIAMSFKFSLYDENFNIHVNDSPVSIDDLGDLIGATEFLWIINEFEDQYISALKDLKEGPISINSSLSINGFIATVSKPAQLKIRGTDERATIDLFVNGRLREKNIIRRIPTQRVVESYIYGQIHFDLMDQTGNDPFTSSREGVIDDDENFKSLLDFLKNDVLPKVFDDWDALRLKHRKDGDDENQRKSNVERKARSLYKTLADEYSSHDEKIEAWLFELINDAEFNISAYAYCFISENLVRKYIREYIDELPANVKKSALKWKKNEDEAKNKANISFDIRINDDDLNFLSMEDLAITAEGGRRNDGNPSLWLDFVKFKPVRNAVGHTGVLSNDAKQHLRVGCNNIKARVRNLIINKN